MVINRVVTGLMTMLLLFVGTAVLADSPKDTKNPDAHSVEVRGKVVLYRVQIEGMNLGQTAADKADAEVFVALDSDPKIIFTLQLKHNSPDVNRVMADILREAYFKKAPVTIYRQIDMKRTNNYKILMVQVN